MWSSLIIIKEVDMTNKMRPIHPGEILKDELEDLEISASELGRRLGVPANRITAIMNEERSVTADTALRLARYFGSTAEFWVNLQSSYDLKMAEKSVGNQISKDVLPYREAA